jgi:hypothetical protein
MIARVFRPWAGHFTLDTFVTVTGATVQRTEPPENIVFDEYGGLGATMRMRATSTALH